MSAIDNGYVTPAKRFPRKTIAIAAVVGFGACVIPAVGAVVTRMFVMEAFKIPSASMAPTLIPGDHVFVDKTKRGTERRGDVVVFRYPPDPSKDYVKRVIAVSGDSVEIDNRDNSADSRLFGCVPVANVKGVVTTIWISFGKHGIRHARGGTKVR